MATNQRREIIGGPSREELFDALRLRHEGRRIPFTVAPEPQQSGSSIKILRETFDVMVDSIGIEDGSGNNWLLHLRYNRHGHLGFHLSGYFNTKTRKGWLQEH